MEMDLPKGAPENLAAVGKWITAIGGTYVICKGNLARYQSKIRGINIEFEIESLKGEEDFNCSCHLDALTIKHLGTLSSGKHAVTFAFDAKRQEYRISNQSSDVPLRHIEDKLGMPLIDEALCGAEKIGVPITPKRKKELIINDNEKYTDLVVRDDTCTGLMNKMGEHFFDPDYRSEVAPGKILLRSTFFLKIGRERFTLQLYRQGNQYLLLTTVSVGTGIQCRMLEFLITL